MKVENDSVTLNFDEKNVEDVSTFKSNSKRKSAQRESRSRKLKIQSRKVQIKPRVRSRWSDDDIFKLISRVKYVPMLWNAKDKKYRNKVERQAAWKLISKVDFNGRFKVSELVAKWSNLRIQYRSYCLKRQESTSGHGANIQWKFFEPMNFVDRAEEELASGTVSNSVCDSLSFLFDSNSKTPEISELRRLSQSSSEATTSSSATSIVSEGMKYSANELEVQRQPRLNEFDVFGNYIATELRSISDPNAAQRIRFKVARCLMECIEAENDRAQRKQ